MRDRGRRGRREAAEPGRWQLPLELEEGDVEPGTDSHAEDDVARRKLMRDGGERDRNGRRADVAVTRERLRDPVGLDAERADHRVRVHLGDLMEDVSRPSAPYGRRPGVIPGHRGELDPGLEQSAAIGASAVERADA